MNEMHQLKAIAQRLDAPSLDTLISSLAEIRAGMQPAVSGLRPSPNDESINQTPITVEDSPAMQANVLRDGRIRLYARSSGFGWLAFNLDLRDARTLRDWFAANVNGISDLIGEKNVQRH